MHAIEGARGLPKWLQRILQVNTTVVVALPDRDMRYRTRIEDVGGNRLAIGAPFEQGHAVHVPLQQPVSLTVMGPTAPIRMMTRVVQTVRRPLPLWIVEVPPEDEIEVVQRRRSVRVAVMLDVVAQRQPVPGEGEGEGAADGAGGGQPPAFWGQVVDISGTGLRMVLRGHLDVEDPVVMRVDFPWGTEELQGRVVTRTPVQERARRLGVPDTDARYSYGVEFTGMPQALEDRIYRFVFDRQRELRMRGLL